MGRLQIDSWYDPTSIITAIENIKIKQLVRIQTLTQIFFFRKTWCIIPYVKAQEVADLLSYKISHFMSTDDMKNLPWTIKNYNPLYYHLASSAKIKK